MLTKYHQPKKLAVCITLLSLPLFGYATESNDLANAPMYLASDEGSPNIMLTLGKEHTIFDTAYNDYIDLNGDGIIDLMFDPSIQYEGNFDYTLCYKYQNSIDGLENVTSDKGDFKYLNDVGAKGYWYPVANSTKIKISDAVDNWPKGEQKEVAVCNKGNVTGTWSGNFLNYISSSKLDVIRRVFYGGARVYNGHVAPKKDSTQVRFSLNGDTGVALLKNSHVTRDAHAWGKVFSNDQYLNDSIQINDYTELSGTGTYFFIFATDESKAFNLNYKHDISDGSNDENFRFAPGFMRYGRVDNAGIPGSKGLNQNDAKNFIWNWASLQTELPNSNCAIASENVTVNCSSDKSSTTKMVNNVKTKSLLVATCTEKFHGINCKKYGNYWQPVGILQQYGEREDSPMRFGLISGNWVDKHQNTASATLRAPIGSFPSEIENNANENANPFEGKKINGDINFKEENNGIVGIIGTLDRYTTYTYNDLWKLFYNDCFRGPNDEKKPYVLPYVAKNINGFGGEKIPTSMCRNWGNPVGKLLHAVGNYYDPSTNFQFTADNDENLGLGHYNLDNETRPYHGTSESANNQKLSDKNYCSKPNALLIADEDISMDDADYFDKFSKYSGSLDSISFNSGKYFVGNSTASGSDEYANIPSLKEVKNLSNISGLAPSAPYSYGTYITAGIAKTLAEKKYIKAHKSMQPEISKDYSMNTYVIAMQPAMPEIKIPVGNNKFVTILPFAKTVSDYDKDENNCKDSCNNARMPTGAIVDFYTQYISDTEGKFRINYEDMQYGSDYDMDWVVSYHYKIHDINGEKYLQIILENEDGDEFASQHAGYVITGTEYDGVYVDLGKTTYSEDHKGNQNNLYDYDTIISDAYVTSLNSSFLQKLKDNPENMNVTLGTSSSDFKDNYKSKIKSYYEKIISNKCNGKPIYYMNRNELNACTKGGFRYWAPPKDVTNWRILGDHARYDKDKIKVTSRLFKINASASDPFIKSPLWYAAKYGLNTEAQKKAENNGTNNNDKDPSNYFKVTNPAKLREGLITILEEISSSKHSNSSFVAQSYSLKTGASAYTTYYNPSTWEGDVAEEVVNSDGHLFVKSSGWNAKQTFMDTPVDKRIIFTRDIKENKVVRFHASGVDDKNKLSYDIGVVESILGGSYNSLNELSEEQIKFITRFTRWMAGDHTYEGTTSVTDANLKLQLNDNLPLRKRANGYVLGDIINSSPLVFDDSTGTKVIAFGANDGMLHFIEANNGKPIVSYLPSQALPYIKKLAKQDYVALHQPFVDSTPGIYNTKDKVVIYGTFGLGVEGAYAIDATKISKTDVDNIENKIIWELNNSDSDFVGKVKDTPTVVMSNKIPYLLMNSGYHANKPGLLIIKLLNDPTNKSMQPQIVNIISDVEMYNGYDVRGYDYNAGAVISTPSITDLSGTNSYEAIYFGDSYGKVWKVDLTDKKIKNNIACWGYNGNTYHEVSNATYDKCQDDQIDKSKPKVIFQAHDLDNKPQPITTKIAIGYHFSGIGLIFGTGSYDLSVDGSIVSAAYNTSQSVYMIRDLSDKADVNASTNAITRSKLLRLAHVTDNGQEYLHIPQQGQTGDVKYGWYYDLHNGQGERVNVDPLVINQYLFVAANTPILSSDCDGGGTSRVYKFNNWRLSEVTEEEIAGVTNYGWLINDLDYTSIDGKPTIIISGDAASGDGEGYTNDSEQIVIPLIINSSWLRLY